MSISGAVNYAAEIHKDDMRKYCNEPYINHCMRVMSATLLHDLTCNEVCGMAAVMHDTIEDHPDKVDPKFIVRWFGGDVLRLIDELTNKYEKDKYPQYNRRTRKIMEFERLRGVSDEAKIIKMLDRIDNLESFNIPPFSMDPKERKKMQAFGRTYGEESMQLFEAIGDVDPDLKDRGMTFSQWLGDGI